MLRKFDWESSSLYDFKGMLASYRTCLEGWDEWIDNMFMASFGLWKHKYQVSHTPFYYYIYEYLICHAMYIT
jgi:hypothetical protein